MAVAVEFRGSQLTVTRIHLAVSGIKLTFSVIQLAVNGSHLAVTV